MKKLFAFFLSLFFYFAFLGCSDKNNASGSELSFTDSTDRKIFLGQSPRRVVSLQGSFAETWLLAGGSLIGVTDEVFSELQLDIPKDTQIVGTIKSPNAETILSLDPDFVILSADIASHKEISKTFERAEIPCAFFAQESFEDYLGMLRIFTALTGRDDLYEKNGTEIGKRIAAVLDSVDKAKGAETDVLFVRARTQGVSAKAKDHMVCDILDSFGCNNIAASDDSMLESISVEQIINSDPDVILAVAMGDEKAAKDYLTKKWESSPAWNGLSAVKNNKYIFLEKRLYHYKPNARWAEAYENLKEILFG